MTVQTGALGVEQEGEGRTAANAAAFIKPLLTRKQKTPTALLNQRLLHLTGQRESERGKRERERERKCDGRKCELNVYKVSDYVLYCTYI